MIARNRGVTLGGNSSGVLPLSLKRAPQPSPQMDLPFWLVITVATLVVGYLLITYAFYFQSRELDKKIDYSKMKAWKDDED